MKRSIEWFVANPAVANLLMVSLLLGGLLAIPNTRQETLPNVPLDRVGIYVSYPQATPETVESLVCTPLENAVDDVEGATEPTSEAQQGLCTVQLDVLEGYATAGVLEQIRTARTRWIPCPKGRPATGSGTDRAEPGCPVVTRRRDTARRHAPSRPSGAARIRSPIRRCPASTWKTCRSGRWPRRYAARICIATTSPSRT